MKFTFSNNWVRREMPGETKHFMVMPVEKVTRLPRSKTLMLLLSSEIFAGGKKETVKRNRSLQAPGQTSVWVSITSNVIIHCTHSLFHHRLRGHSNSRARVWGCTSSRTWQRVLVFPRLALRECFPALGTG